MKSTKSRHGLHRDGNVLLGGMVEPRKKAIALVTASVLAEHNQKLTTTDIVWRGISNLARQAGVLDDNDQVTERFADAVAVMEESVIITNRNNRGTRGGRRAR